MATELEPYDSGHTDPTIATSSAAPMGADAGGHPASLRNYAVVWEDKLTRSGISRDKAGWQWLWDQGVKSIVTLREENDVDYSQFGFEQVLRIPLGDKPPDLPSDEQAERFLRFIQDPPNQPVHVHCGKGKDRTGMMIALARYSVDGWPMDQALAEARVYRGGKDLLAVQAKWLNRWAARHPPGSYRLKQWPSRGRRGSDEKNGH
ncbi:MAG: tyrosine-protein phosphatase [Candidatus Tectomicrobia bacterium]|uniref:Tyrosine-protein phosphatase n=1 Tax=Tectimicrobiota bacterium TaxID=2528274 RepID=A0A932FVE9_UNCTE|nr:tyrosine-protein phosphatase [Candidatus Tectomicrobia bacterium]